LANLFQKTLKIVANKHKHGDTFPKKPIFCRFLANFFIFFQKTENLQPNIPFQKTVSPFDDFSSQKKKNRPKTKITAWR